MEAGQPTFCPRPVAGDGAVVMAIIDRAAAWFAVQKFGLRRVRARA
jgi:hypothetical protein